MKVLACGSRNYLDTTVVFATLNGIYQWRPIRTLIEGGARGADTIAGQWASLVAGVERITVSARWDELGKRAGYVRNMEMLDMGPDLVVAFCPPSGITTGTNHTVTEAQRRGIQTWVVLA